MKTTVTRLLLLCLTVLAFVGACRGEQDGADDFAVTMASSAAAPPCAPAPVGATMQRCWESRTITLEFNPSLDMGLELGVDDRVNAFVTAAALWETQLQAIDPAFNIVVNVGAGYAEEQSPVTTCVDPRNMNPVFQNIMIANDGTSDTSTGQQVAGPGDGWIHSTAPADPENPANMDNVDGPSTVMSAGAARLAETGVDDSGMVPGGQCGKRIVEANIAWFTHFPGAAQCKHIEWNYDTAMPGGLQFDFQTVMAHEIGHALGLGHINVGGNIMNWSVATGDQVVVFDPGEVAALTYLYHPVTGVCPAPPPPPPGN